MQFSRSLNLEDARTPGLGKDGSQGTREGFSCLRTPISVTEVCRWCWYGEGELVQEVNLGLAIPELYPRHDSRVGDSSQGLPGNP